MRNDTHMNPLTGTPKLVWSTPQPPVVVRALPLPSRTAAVPGHGKRRPRLVTRAVTFVATLTRWAGVLR